MDHEFDSSQQFSLKWHNHQSTVSSALDKWFWTGGLADVNLVAGSETIKAHKLVLALCSQYFAELFKELECENTTTIVIVGCEPKELQLLLKFMYTGEVTADSTMLPCLLHLANMLRVTPLTDANISVPETRQSHEQTNESTNMQTNTQTQHTTENIPDETMNNEVINKDETSNVEQLSKLDQIVKNLYSSRDLIKTNDIVNNFSAKRTDSTGSGVICPICHKRLSNAYNLRVHIETHTGIKHSCLYCTHISRSRDALRKHVAYRHPNIRNN